jgi:hypothetical protein
MTRNILAFFDKLEDKTRAKLSRVPLLYAFLGGIGIVLFWRGFFWQPFAVTGTLLIRLPYLLRQRFKIQSSRKVADEYIESFLYPKPVTFWGLFK